ncbi:MAG TPA: aminoglycoside phosphotransferase [Verrucomicrobiales bacterium]|nr:aminoglycoside phosphotransferase [Verrucomicrobiales bacterium]
MPHTSEQWRREHADVYFLDPGQPDELRRHLASLGFLQAGEQIRRVARAGEGNMNCTVRVTTSRRSFIAKQARPWVEKYPQFAAPWDRALRELEFYGLAATQPSVARALPALLGSDPGSRLLLLEDLGEGTDYTDSYRGAGFAAEAIGILADFLGELHGRFHKCDARRGLANHEMRALNSQHVFFIPLQTDNGLDLDSISPGLQEAKERLCEDSDYVSEVHALAEIYLSDGDHLLHGDFFPGSMLRTSNGPRIIDPEFAFFGRPEFDPGVFVAHLLLGRQPADSIQQLLTSYRRPPGFEDSLMVRFVGVEIMRRLIGYAQLPLGADGPARCRLLELSRKLVLAPSVQAILQHRHEP